MNGAASPRIRKTMVFVLLALFLGQFGSGVYDLIFSNFLRDAQQTVARLLCSLYLAAHVTRW